MSKYSDRGVYNLSILFCTTLGFIIFFFLILRHKGVFATRVRCLKSNCALKDQLKLFLQFKYTVALTDVKVACPSLTKITAD